MYSVEAIYDGTTFMPKEPLPVNGNYKVVITFLEPVAEVKRPISELRGFLKGKVMMADDFNEPLEEFKEYM